MGVKVDFSEAPCIWNALNVGKEKVFWSTEKLYSIKKFEIFMEGRVAVKGDFGFFRKIIICP